MFDFAIHHYALLVGVGMWGFIAIKARLWEGSHYEAKVDAWIASGTVVGKKVFRRFILIPGAVLMLLFYGFLSLSAPEIDGLQTHVRESKAELQQQATTRNQHTLGTLMLALGILHFVAITSFRRDIKDAAIGSVCGPLIIGASWPIALLGFIAWASVESG